MTAAASRADSLRSTAESFCKAFVSGTSPTTILDDYFTPNASITEHGPSWAAERLHFLGRMFQGRRQQDSAHNSGSTCDDYYDLLTSTLLFHPTEKTLPSIDEFLVDPEAKGTNGRGSVTVKLQAEFKSVKTGKGWKEDFVYVLSEFDGEGRLDVKSFVKSIPEAADRLKVCLDQANHPTGGLEEGIGRTRSMNPGK